MIPNTNSIGHGLDGAAIGGVDGKSCLVMGNQTVSGNFRNFMMAQDYGILCLRCNYGKEPTNLPRSKSFYEESWTGFGVVDISEAEVQLGVERIGKRKVPFFTCLLEGVTV